MHQKAKIGFSIHDIQHILMEDQCLFDRTIAELKRRNSFARLDATQSQRHLNRPGDGLSQPKVMF